MEVNSVPAHHPAWCYHPPHCLYQLQLHWCQWHLHCYCGFIPSSGLGQVLQWQDPAQVLTKQYTGWSLGVSTKNHEDVSNVGNPVPVALEKWLMQAMEGPRWTNQWDSINCSPLQCPHITNQHLFAPASCWICNTLSTTWRQTNEHGWRVMMEPEHTSQDHYRQTLYSCQHLQQSPPEPLHQHRQRTHMWQLICGIPIWCLLLHIFIIPHLWHPL